VLSFHRGYEITVSRWPGERQEWMAQYGRPGQTQLATAMGGSKREVTRMAKRDIDSALPSNPKKRAAKAKRKSPDSRSILRRAMRGT
jgi:hypothetical protein